MALDIEVLLRCLGEVEGELFRVAEHADCHKFHKESQLTAVLLLLLRASSLVRSMLFLVQYTDLLDGFHLVARGFEETWNLAHELRLSDHRDRAEKWLVGDANSWSARLGVIMNFAIGRGHRNPTLGRDYGLLSELAHPTRSAAENSVTLCGVRKGIEGTADQILSEVENCEKRVTAVLYRLLWLIVDQDARFMVIPFRRENMSTSIKYVDAYRHVDPAT